MTLTELAPPLVRGTRLDGMPVAIIGAGPIGLAAAAHLSELGIDFVVFEAGASAAASIATWGHTRLFSPWSLLIDGAAERMLRSTTDWTSPDPDSLPTGSELIRDYLEPLSELPAIKQRTRYSTTVTAVSREGMDRTRSIGRDERPFVLRLHDDSGATEFAARAVIDASGTYSNPNHLSSNGLDPLGWAAVKDAVTHALPDVLGRDRGQFARRRTLVVGAGHSAANTLIALSRLAASEPGTSITWAIRNPSAVRVSSSDDDQLAARATLGNAVDSLVASGLIDKVDSFELDSLRRVDDEIVVRGRRGGEPAELRVDVVVNATGFRPDLEMLREVRLALDEVVEAPRLLAPLIDPNVHSCGTVEPHGFLELQHPERNFFIAGTKSYGRAPTFLLATGYEQVRSITAWLSGDLESARKVELVLPATGVCSTDISPSDSCCGA
jgi:thioredoxin reductase